MRNFQLAGELFMKVKTFFNTLPIYINNHNFYFQVPILVTVL
ncbi:hypothetical protein l11_05100 [Neisseria weaveri LMG 5135]|nr:hypothetical protein l11_05100 [Neisseria weaveri LMG 5135]